MKNVLAFILTLLTLLLQACGINLPEGGPARGTQAVEDEIIDEDAREPAITELTDVTAAPVSPSGSSSQEDYDGSLWGEPDTDF